LLIGRLLDLDFLTGALKSSWLFFGAVGNLETETRFDDIFLLSIYVLYNEAVAARLRALADAETVSFM